MRVARAATTRAPTTVTTRKSTTTFCEVGGKQRRRRRKLILKNFAKTNKSNDYVKGRGYDAHYYDARRPSDGEESPSGNNTDAQSDGEIEDASESSRSASIIMSRSLTKRGRTMWVTSPQV
jgi:hypothetical protein